MNWRILKVTEEVTQYGADDAEAALEGAKLLNILEQDSLVKYVVSHESYLNYLTSQKG